MKNFYIFLVVLFVGNYGFSQTTVSYNFATPGASTSGSLDTNISFSTAQNFATPAPNIVSGQLYLYGDGTKGGSIIISCLNGVTITNIVINASGRTGNAAYTVDGGLETELPAGAPYLISAISAANEVEFYQKQNGNNKEIYVDNFSVTYTTTPITYTFDGTWSPSNPNGVATASDDLIITNGNAVVSQNTTTNSVTVNPGTSLTIDSGTTLTVGDATDGLTLESSSTSYSSLVVDGTVSGVVNYERHVNLFTGTAGGNDLISAPLSGQTWTGFRTFGTNAADLLDDGNTSPTAYAFAPFDKTAVPADFVNFTDASSATLTSGLGYRAATDVGTTLTFTGTPLNGLVNPQISNSGTGFEEWNLIGNPYASYISAFDFLNHNINNNAVLDNMAGAIYGYNGQTSNKYDILNLSTVSGPGNDVLIAPGQGFFVASGVPVGTIQFTTDGTPSAPDMRRTSGGDDFIAGRTGENYNLELELSTSVKSFKTDFYFNDNSSLGLDPGYDAKLFGESAPDFSIYSHLVEDNTGLAMGIQSLGSADLVDTSIALGVNANQGEQLRFSIAQNTLDATVDVYLEDTVAGTTTLLNTGDYILTPATNLSGTGRFFLRFADSALSVTDTTLDNLNIYTNTADKTIVIAGQLLEATTAHVYDLQGRRVISKQLGMSNVSQAINVSSLSAGVYVVQLSNPLQSKSQKVIIR